MSTVLLNNTVVLFSQLVLLALGVLLLQLGVNQPQPAMEGIDCGR